MLADRGAPGEGGHGGRPSDRYGRPRGRRHRTPRPLPSPRRNRPRSVAGSGRDRPPRSPADHDRERPLRAGSGSKALGQGAVRPLRDPDADRRGWLTRHPEAPRIYDCPNLQYQEEPPGQEDWQDVATCLRLEKADCDDLANWCTAERRVRDGLRGARTGQRKAVRRDGGTLYHVFTEIPGRPPEDPSRILGMR